MEFGGVCLIFKSLERDPRREREREGPAVLGKVSGGPPKGLNFFAPFYILLESVARGCFCYPLLYV